MTDDLWLAEMGSENLSYFTGNLDLPVEQVSWDDVQGFLAASANRFVKVLGAESTDAIPMLVFGLL